MGASGGSSPKRPSRTGPAGAEAKECEREALLELPLVEFFFFLASTGRRRAAAASACASRSSRSSDDDPAEDITYSFVRGTGESDTATSMAGAEVMISPLCDELTVMGFIDDDAIVTASSEEGIV